MCEQKEFDEALHAWAIRLCLCAGETEAAGEKLWQELCAEEDILQEFAYYYEHQEFLCAFEPVSYTHLRAHET